MMLSTTSLAKSFCRPEIEKLLSSYFSSDFNTLNRKDIFPILLVLNAIKRAYSKDHPGVWQALLTVLYDVVKTQPVDDALKRAKVMISGLLENQPQLADCLIHHLPAPKSSLKRPLHATDCIVQVEPKRARLTDTSTTSTAKYYNFITPAVSSYLAVQGKPKSVVASVRGSAPPAHHVNTTATTSKATTLKVPAPLDLSTKKDGDDAAVDPIPSVPRNAKITVLSKVPSTYFTSTQQVLGNPTKGSCRMVTPAGYVPISSAHSSTTKSASLYTLTSRVSGPGAKPSFIKVEHVEPGSIPASRLADIRILGTPKAAHTNNTSSTTRLNNLELKKTEWVKLQTVKPSPANATSKDASKKERSFTYKIKRNSTDDPNEKATKAIKISPKEAPDRVKQTLEKLYLERKVQELLQKLQPVQTSQNPKKSTKKGVKVKLCNREDKRPASLSESQGSDSDPTSESASDTSMVDITGVGTKHSLSVFPYQVAAHKVIKTEDGDQEYLLVKTDDIINGADRKQQGQMKADVTKRPASAGPLQKLEDMVARTPEKVGKFEKFDSTPSVITFKNEADFDKTVNRVIDMDRLEPANDERQECGDSQVDNETKSDGLKEHEMPSVFPWNVLYSSKE